MGACVCVRVSVFICLSMAKMQNKNNTIEMQIAIATDKTFVGFLAVIKWQKNYSNANANAFLKP